MKRAALTVFLVFGIILSAIAPTNATAGNVFAKNSSATGKIALTFDDGPHPIYTPKILEILEIQKIERPWMRKTFSLLGNTYWPLFLSI